MKRILFFLIPTLVIQANAQPKKELTLNLKESKTYRISQTTDQDIIQTIMGTDQEIKNHSEGLISFYVKDAGKSGYMLEIAFTKMKMKMTSPYMNIDLDSEKPADEGNHYAALFNKLVGMKFNATVDRHGKIVDFSGLEDTYARMVDSIGLPNSNKMQLLEQLNQSFGDNIVKTNLKALTSFYPQDKVAEKQSWHKEENTETVIPMVIDNTWTLSEINKHEMVISGVADIRSRKDEEVTINMMPAKVDITGKQTTVYNIHPRSGWILSGETRSEFSGIVALQKSAQIPGGMNVPITLSTKTVFARVE